MSYVCLVLLLIFKIISCGNLDFLYSIVDNYGHTYNVIQEYDRQGKYFYTQCLQVYEPGVLLESGGLYGKSSLHLLKLEDMSIKKNQDFNNSYFAEGCTFFSDSDGKKHIFMLTYKEKKIFKFLAEDFIQEDILTQPSELAEGWGLYAHSELINDQEQIRLYATDGTSRIHVYDTDFNLQKTIQVEEKGNNVKNLNELEFVGQYLWANVYLTNDIIVIDTETGKVKDRYDFSFLLERASNYLNLNYGGGLRYDECLNGIAYDKDEDVIYLTGKDWPLIFKIKLDAGGIEESP